MVIGNIVFEFNLITFTSGVHVPPPAQNQYMQERKLGELIFSRIHGVPVFALARIQEITFEGSFSAY